MTVSASRAWNSSSANTSKFIRWRWSMPTRLRRLPRAKRSERLVRNYADPAAYFVDRLAEGVGTIAAAFYPKPVIVRLSDFKTNEYARLLGGEGFEPKEENPMLGFRGAARYAHPAYEAGFALECAALRRVREDMGLTNVRVMVPFCRRVEEAKRVIDAMAKHGLKRGENGLEIYVMCEIPNNVIQIDAFAELFDGFSIGSNDLTQLTLGVDRDSEIVAFDFDERDPGMLEMLRLAVTGAKRNRTPCRNLRRGAGQLSGDRELSGATRHRFDQRQPLEHLANDAGRQRSRGRQAEQNPCGIKRRSDAGSDIGTIDLPQFIKKSDSGFRGIHHRIDQQCLQSDFLRSANGSLDGKLLYVHLHRDKFGDRIRQGPQRNWMNPSASVTTDLTAASGDPESLEVRALELGNNTCALTSTETPRRFNLSAGYAQFGPPEPSLGKG